MRAEYLGKTHYLGKADVHSEIEQIEQIERIESARNYRRSIKSPLAQKLHCIQLRLSAILRLRGFCA